MTTKEFIERANRANDDCEEIDRLCYLWLEHKAAQWQKNGRIAVEALKIFKHLTEN
ncbi:MAG: hypothetical protein ACXWAT_12145 [Methylobacter sp.]